MINYHQYTYTKTAMNENLYNSFHSEQEAYASEVLWMPSGEAEMWRGYKGMVLSSTGMGLLGWFTMYGLSHLFGAAVRKQYNGLNEKDRSLFHIYFVSVTHAIMAVLMGTSWIWAEWNSFPDSRVFGFNFPYYINSTISFSYMVFDMGIIILNAGSYEARFLVSITAHHLVLMFGYLLVVSFPAVLAFKVFAIF